MKSLPLFSFAFLLIVTQPVRAQYTLQQSEDLFRQKNLLLLAEQYAINAAQAAVIQAKIWDLPYLSVELNALNPQGARVFDIGGEGQKTLAIQQLIYMGGKKKHEVEFAKANAGIAELQFEALVRTLRYQLRNRYYSLYFDLKKIESVHSQAERVDTLIQAYTTQVQKGNLPLKDLVRLQSLSLSLKNDYLSLQRDVVEEQRDLMLLTGISVPIVPVIDEQQLQKRYELSLSPNIDELLDLAKEKNPDYLISQKILESQELYVRWQRSLATPDLIAGASYDQRGGAFTNQVNLTFGVPLPFWNRNRGAIKVAEWQLGQSKIHKDYKAQELRGQLQASLLTWEQQSHQYHLLSAGNQDMDMVYNAVLVNFRRGNIPLLEFTDFMESYNQSMLLLNELRKNLILSKESVNQLVNSNIF